MSANRHFRSFFLLLALAFGGLRASAQAPSLPAPAADPAALVQPTAQRQADYLTDALHLHKRQTLALKAAVQMRLAEAEMLNHLLFVSEQAATAAYDAVDYRYYAALGKVLSSTQFHLLLQIDEPANPADNALMVRSH